MERRANVNDEGVHGSRDWDYERAPSSRGNDRRRDDDCVGARGAVGPSPRPPSRPSPPTSATSDGLRRKRSVGGTVRSHDTSRPRNVVVQSSRRKDAQDLLDGSSSCLPPPPRSEPSRPEARGPKTQDRNGSPKRLRPPRSEPSRPEAHENGDMPRDARGLPNAVLPPPQRSCLKKSAAATVAGSIIVGASSPSRDSADDRREDGDDDDRGTVRLLNLLLTLDCTLTAGQRLAGGASTQRSPPRASGRKGPFLDPGDRVPGGGDGARPGAERPNYYKPRRKRAGRAAEKTGDRESTKERRRRQARILRDDGLDKSFNTDSTKSSSGSFGSDDSLDIMMSMMSTGSMTDMQKRHVPVANAKIGNEAWASIDSIDWSLTNRLADAPPSKFRAPKTIGDLQRKIDRQGAPPATRSYSLQVTPGANSLVESMIGRRRQNSLADVAINRPKTAGSVDGSDGLEISLKLHEKSKGKECVTDVQKRYSSDSNETTEESASSNINGNDTSSPKASLKAQRSPSVTSTNSMLSMMSTGSYKDTRRRHIPTMAAKSKRQDQDQTLTGTGIANVDWGATSDDGVGLALQSQPQTYVLATAGSAGAGDASLPTRGDKAVLAVERQKQRRLAVTGNDSLTNQQETPDDKALLRRKAAQQLIRDLKKRHKERQLSKQALDNSGLKDNSARSDNIDHIATAVDKCSTNLKRSQTKKSSSRQEKKKAANELKTVRVHSLPATKPKEEQSPCAPMPSGRLIGESTGKQQLTED